LAHLERWDGNGYPLGLKGCAIPLPGRILAVADTFDAMISKRPYKGPLSVDVAFALLRARRATAFDPEVVDAFFDSESEILEIKATYQDNDVSSLFRLAEAN
jgi:putative two-component system response regulator